MHIHRGLSHILGDCPESSGDFRILAQKLRVQKPSRQPEGKGLPPLAPDKIHFTIAKLAEKYLVFND